MLEEALNRSGRALMSAYGRALLDTDVVRRVPLPAGPKIIAANHPTTTDPFLLLTAVREPMSILVTQGCFEVPVFGHYLRMAGHVPVSHRNGRPAFGEAKRLLESGRTVGIFPEGALSPLNGSWGFHRPHTGAVRLALSTGAPVVPVGIHLPCERVRVFEFQFDGVPTFGRWCFHGPYAMTVGEPMHLSGDVEDREYVRFMSRRIMRRIVLLSRESTERVEDRQGEVVGGTGWLRDVGRWMGVEV